MNMIDVSSFIPIYEQVKRGMKKRILSGALMPKDALPTIRDLAEELLINPNTVARAYRELEQEGFITTRMGKGCFVAGEISGLLAREKSAACGRLFDAALTEALALGLDAGELRTCFEERLNLVLSPAKGEPKR
jgi:DNA-binding transcriptional regulator YhcF (GntR family)